MEYPSSLWFYCAVSLKTEEVGFAFLVLNLITESSVMQGSQSIGRIPSKLFKNRIHLTRSVIKIKSKNYTLQEFMAEVSHIACREFASLLRFR